MSKSSKFIKEIKKNPQNYFIIHYSCQSLNDDNEGFSPRITSIAIEHFSTRQTVSFSTHAIAEELKINKQDVLCRFDDIERKLISDFYDFAKERKDKYWIHWNMRNLTFGFEHIQHRCRVLGIANPPVIPVESRINLNDLLSNRYGYNYADHPKLENLMRQNEGLHRNFLTGKEEVQAFQEGDYIKMHNSTLSKTGFFYSVIQHMIRGRLKTKSKGLGVRLDTLFESRLAKGVGLFSTIISLPSALYFIVTWFGK